MTLRYEYDGYAGIQRLDLTNIPKDCITVTVSIADEKLKRVIEDRMTQLKRGLEKAVQCEEWTIASRISLKLKVLEEVVAEAAKK
ncbi:hypothetical protein [Streptomyces pseudogriseolus]|uniref:hypothetical protein n=1 Tax=Streptomyces pseudogriseolus TaxID=36817 RepID=UPI003FA310C4